MIVRETNIEFNIMEAVEISVERICVCHLQKKVKYIMMLDNMAERVHVNEV